MEWVGWSGVGWSGVVLNPNLLSALAPFGLVKVGAEFGAELDNKRNIGHGQGQSLKAYL